MLGCGPKRPRRPSTDDPGWHCSLHQAGKILALGLALATSTPGAAAAAVSTFAGVPVDMAHPDGLFLAPNAVATDAFGNVYVCKLTPAGTLTPLAGTAGLIGSADGQGTAALFNGPNGLGVDGAGNVYVADSGNSTIRKITPSGMVSTLAGTAGQTGCIDGQGASARFYWPFGIAVTASGIVYVAEPVNDVIRMITPDGTVTTLAGQVLSDGNMTGEARTQSLIDGQGSAATFDFPHGLALDGSGNILVADTGNNLIRKVTPAGQVSTVAGQVLVRGSADGPAAFATLFHPAGLAVAASGTIYVADTLNGTIRVISPSGVVTTLAGAPLWPGSADGVGRAAAFNHPSGIDVDPAGNLFVADTLNDTIRKITF